MPAAEEGPPPSVAVVLVVHNGERWLPTFLAALPAAISAHSVEMSSVSGDTVSAGTFDTSVGSSWFEADDVPQPRDEFDWGDDASVPKRDLPQPTVNLIAVDTGSVDDSSRLLREAGFTVLEAEPSAPFGRAVAAARAHLDSAGVAVQWLWLVHDDTEPQAQCLPELLAMANAENAAVCGPMVLQWGANDRIAELGIRLTGAGRRVTGVDPGEVDQGQHDDDRATRTLAVSSTAMLVRIDMWDRLMGFDPALPMSGDDIDFCRRVWRAGENVVFAPRAKVRHAAAMSTLRRPHSRSLRPRRDLRLAAMHMQIAHAPSLWWPVVALRMTVGTFVAAGVAAARSDFAGARDEIDGLVRFLAHPSRVFASRHRVAATSLHSHAVEREFAVPLRERMRVVTRAVVNLTEALTRITGNRGSSPIFMDEDPDDVRTVRAEVFRRLWHRPIVLVPAVLTVLLLVAHIRLLLGGGPVSAELWPSTVQTSGDLWRSYLSSWHDIGRGSASPAPPWIFVLAILALPFGGSVNAALVFLLVFFVPLFVVSFALSFRSVVASPWARTIAGLCVAGVPLLSEARDRGDISVLVVALLLPPLARLAVLALASPSPQRWARLALLLTLVVAFEPLIWMLAVVLAVVMLTTTPSARAHIARVVVTLLLPWLALLPMSLQWLQQPSLLLMSSGAISGQPTDVQGIWSQTLGLSTQGWHWWGVIVVVIAAAAMVRGASHRFTRDLGVAALVPLVLLVVANHVTFRVAGLVRPTGPDPSVLMLLIALACGVSLATAGDGLLPALRERSLGIRHFSAGVGIAAIAATIVGGVWMWSAAPDSTVARGSQVDLPAFAAVDLDSPERPRVLVLRADDPAPLAFAVRSSRLSSVGEDDMLRMQGGDSALADAVRTLVAQGEMSAGNRAAAVATFKEAGIRYIALTPQGNGASAVAQALVRAPSVRQLAAAQDGRGWWLWRVSGDPARAMISPLRSAAPKGGSPGEHAIPWSDFVAVDANDPGRIALAATTSDADTPCCLVSPGTIRIADATQGWNARVDGRPATIERSASGTVVLDLPLGVRSDLVLERRDRGRSIWLVIQACVLAALALAAVPSRRKDDSEQVQS